MKKHFSILFIGLTFFGLCQPQNAVADNSGIDSSGPCTGLFVRIAPSHKNDPQAQYIQNLVCEVIRISYPDDLAKTRIKIKTVDTDGGTNFRSLFNLARILGEDHGYVLKFNSKYIFDLSNPLGEFEIKSVLAHELAHTMNYKSGSFFKALGNARVLWDRHFNAKFERWTDFYSYRAGYRSGQRYIDGSINYKIWTGTIGASSNPAPSTPASENPAPVARTEASLALCPKFNVYLEAKSAAYLRDYIDSHLASSPDRLERLFEILLKTIPLCQAELEKTVHDFESESL